MKVYDCFTFYNELDILEIRLHELDSVVDYFVLVEATTTFSGKHKTLWFDKNKERYRKYADKIIHVVVNDMPEIQDGDRWPPQIFQRRQIIRGIKKCLPSDIVMISDVDEIPDKQTLGEVIKKLQGTSTIQDIKELIHYPILRMEKYFSQKSEYRYFTMACRKLRRLVLPTKRIYRFRHREHEYFLNGYVNDYCPGTTVMRFSTLKSVFDMDCHEPRKIWTEGTYLFVKGGWHFTYMGGVDSIANKIEHLSESRFDPNQFNDKQWIQQCINKGENLYGKAEDRHKITYVEIDETYPEYVQINRERLKKYIKEL